MEFGLQGLCGYNRLLDQPPIVIKFMRIQKNLLALLLCLVSVNLFAAGDYAAGKIKAYTCTGCHGIVNYNNAYPTYHVPRVGGQNEEYIKIALKAYQSGERKHQTMNPQAESLSDQDIENIASYLAGQKSKTAANQNQMTGKGQDKSEVCQACHGQRGKSTQPIYPNLGGQQQDYLEKALRDYRDGTRKNALMNGFAANLSDEDIEDITGWYANQTGLTEITDK